MIVTEIGIIIMTERERENKMVKHKQLKMTQRRKLKIEKNKIVKST